MKRALGATLFGKLQLRAAPTVFVDSGRLQSIELRLGLRCVLQIVLNKDETRAAQTRAKFFHRLSEIRDRSFEPQ